MAAALEVPAAPSFGLLPDELCDEPPEPVPEPVPELVPELVPEELPEPVPEELPEELPEPVPAPVPAPVPDEPDGVTALSVAGKLNVAVTQLVGSTATATSRPGSELNFHTASPLPDARQA